MAMVTEAAMKLEGGAVGQAIQFSVARPWVGLVILNAVKDLLLVFHGGAKSRSFALLRMTCWWKLNHDRATNPFRQNPHFQSRRTLIGGLGDTVALGVTTNQAFLSRRLAHSVFAGGDATTTFVTDHAASLLDIDAEIAARANAIAALLLRTGKDKVAASRLLLRRRDRPANFRTGTHRPRCRYDSFHL